MFCSLHFFSGHYYSFYFLTVTDNNAVTLRREVIRGGLLRVSDMPGIPGGGPTLEVLTALQRETQHSRQSSSKGAGERKEVYAGNSRSTGLPVLWGGERGSGKSLVEGLLSSCRSLGDGYPALRLPVRWLIFYRQYSLMVKDAFSSVYLLQTLDKTV